MNLLLDTCTFLWVVTDDEALSPHARVLVADPSVQVFLSSVSAWEIAVKTRLGRLPLAEPPAEWVPRQRQQHRIEPLALGEAATLQLSKLPDLHRDPFDRMLICQAAIHGLLLVTPDALIRQYPVATAW